jgi:hypothetical protein
MSKPKRHPPPFRLQLTGFGEAIRVSTRWRAAWHELRCRECRVTWRSWLLRVLSWPAGMEP